MKVLRLILAAALVVSMGTFIGCTKSEEKPKPPASTEKTVEKTVEKTTEKVPEAPK
jgi:hypothetical protein